MLRKKVSQNFQTLFERISWHKTSALSLTGLLMILFLGSNLPNVLALTWQPQVTIGAYGGGNYVYFEPAMRSRPTDGVAYLLGRPGYPVTTPQLYLSFSNSLNANININDTANAIPMNPHLNFDTSGNAYVVWRKEGNTGYLRKINPNIGSSDPGNEIGQQWVDGAGGGRGPLSQPDVFVSKLTGKIYIVGYESYPVYGMSMGIYDYPSRSFVYRHIGLGENGGGDVKARICINNSRGVDDIQISQFSARELYGVTGFKGDNNPNNYDWSWTSTKLTNSAPDPPGNAVGNLGFPDIGCGDDGYSYIAFNSLSSTNNGYSIGLARYTPGAGGTLGNWALVNRGYPGTSFPEYDIFGPTYSETWAGAADGATGAAVKITPDNRVWVGAGINAGPYSGSVVGIFSNRGQNLDSFDRVINRIAATQGSAIDGVPANGVMHFFATFKEPGVRESIYTYTNFDPGPPTLAGTAFSFNQINLSWSMPYLGDLTKIEIQRSSDGGANWVTITPVGGLPIASNGTFNDTNLPNPGFTYNYRIRAYNTIKSTPYSTPSLAIATLGPAYLTYNTNPGQIDLNRAFGTNPVIAIRDSKGNVITNYSGNVTLSLATSPSGSALNGNKVKAFVNGIATFNSGDNLQLTKLGNYTLRASAPGIPAGTLAQDIGIIVQGKLEFNPGAPSGVTANTDFAATVQLKRIYENSVITEYTGPVTLAIKSGTGAPGATLKNSGVSPVTGTLTAGVANFANLQLDKYGGGYQLRATGNASEPITLGDSGAFNVGATPVITAVTSPVTANTSFSVTAEVRIGGTLLSNYNGAVQISLSSSPGGGDIFGILNVTAVNGVATFNDLSVDVNGSYTLKLTLPLGEISDTSAPIASFNAGSFSGCNTMLVSVNSDSNGVDNVSSGCTVQLREALQRAAVGQVVRIPDSISSITLDPSRGNITIAAGRKLEGHCGASGPVTTISAPSAMIFNLSSNSILEGVKFIGPTNGIRIKVDDKTVAGTGPNKFFCVKVSAT